MIDLFIPKFENACFFFVYRDMDAYGKWDESILRYLSKYSDDLLEMHIFSESTEFRAVRKNVDEEFIYSNVTDEQYKDTYWGHSDVRNSPAFAPIRSLSEDKGIVSFTDSRNRKKILFAPSVKAEEAAELKLLVRNFFPLTSLDEGYRLLGIRRKNGQPL